jgi:hypothetical protein
MEQIQLPKVKKRRFKRYLPLIVLMVIVAVGYYAFRLIKKRENRPQKVDVKQLCIQLVHDLQTDTANLQKTILLDSKLIDKNDSLLMIFQGPVAKPDSDKVRKLIIAGYFSKTFQPSLKGRTAIKDEYHLKEISGSKIPAYIADYESSLDTLKLFSDLQTYDLDSDIRSFFKANFTNAKKQEDEIGKTSTPGITHVSEDDVNRFNAALSIVQDCNTNLISNAQKAKSKAGKLIDYIKKRYRL